MKQKLQLSNLTTKQKEGLKDGSLSIAALLSGAGLFSLFGNTAPADIVEDVVPTNIIPPISGESTDLIEECPVDETTDAEALVIETDAEFATGDYDALTFGGADGAFATAREAVGPGGFFQWKGQTYNTYTKEEWDAMSEEQLNDYAANLEANSQYDAYEFVPQTQIASQSYDLNNDGITDVVMSDIDGDGVLEVDKVDLNSDGNIDVVHASESVHTADDQITQVSYSEAEPVYGVEDLNNDGIIDAVAIDNNNDGYADTVIVDQNHDGIADAGAVNIGDDQDLDILIVDEDFNDEIEGSEIDLIEEELRMDEFIILNEEEVDDLIDNKEHQVNQNEVLISELDDDANDFEGIEL